MSTRADFIPWWSLQQICNPFLLSCPQTVEHLNGAKEWSRNPARPQLLGLKSLHLGGIELKRTLHCKCWSLLCLTTTLPENKTSPSCTDKAESQKPSPQSGWIRRGTPQPVGQTAGVGVSGNLTHIGEISGENTGCTKGH